MSLAALAIIAYKDPWRVERTRKLLSDKGFKLPKKYIELPNDDSDTSEDFEEEELETNDEVSTI